MFLQEYRTLIVLTLAQCFGHTALDSGSAGGIVGAQIAPSADLATLPPAVQILRIASAAIPASLLMSRFGRRAGWSYGPRYCGGSASGACG